MKKTFFLLILVAGVTSLTTAQEQISASADKAYEHLGYKMYADEAQVKAGENVANTAVAGKLANSYRLNGNYSAAAYWYARAIGEGAPDEYYLHYAQALKATGNCPEAVKMFQKYQEKVGAENADLITFTEDCKTMPAPYFGGGTVKMVKGVNTGQLDFSPMPVDGGLIFTSTRDNFDPIVRNDMWTKQKFTNLFFAKRNDDGSFCTPEQLPGSVNRKYHDGVACFAAGGSKMYFTRNNDKGKNSKDLIDLKIYSANKVNNEWTDIEEMPINSEDFGTCHPALSADGLVMVFASDRPGGFGGMDLYRMEWTNGSWSAPVNLGNEINSAGNEIFPFVDNQNRLFFSTNGWAGMGGLDVFICENVGKGAWREPINIGPPLNSEMDDFGIFVNTDGKSGYLSSSRAGGVGGDDIYEWNALFSPEISNERDVVVVDAETGSAIPGATVKLMQMVETNGLITDEITKASSPLGKVGFTNNPHRIYVFNVEKPGYQPKKVSVTSGQLAAIPGDYEIPIDRINELAVPGDVIKAGTMIRIPSASVEITNLCDNSIVMTTTDINGDFGVKMKCGCTYRFVTKKNGFVVATKEVTMNCDEPVAKVEIAMAPIGSPVIPAEYPREGDVIALKDVYYDFDKWEIRPDAGRDLDNVVNLLNRYPSMELELGSHTDARGSDEYNLSLSQKRAEAAVQYIISRGISNARIKARGYGETTLRNGCANGVECDEDQHQENRRTEIRVTKFDNQDVKVIYENE